MHWILIWRAQARRTIVGKSCVLQTSSLLFRLVCRSKCRYILIQFYSLRIYLVLRSFFRCFLLPCSRIFGRVANWIVVCWTFFAATVCALYMHSYTLALLHRQKKNKWNRHTQTYAPIDTTVCRIVCTTKSQRVGALDVLFHRSVQCRFCFR